MSLTPMDRGLLRLMQIRGAMAGGFLLAAAAVGEAFVGELAPVPTGLLLGAALLLLVYLAVLAPPRRYRAWGYGMDSRRAAGPARGVDPGPDRRSARPGPAYRREPGPAGTCLRHLQPRPPYRRNPAQPDRAARPCARHRRAVCATRSAAGSATSRHERRRRPPTASGHDRASLHQGGAADPAGAARRTGLLLAQRSQRRLVPCGRPGDRPAGGEVARLAALQLPESARPRSSSRAASSTATGEAFRSTGSRTSTSSGPCSPACSGSPRFGSRPERAARTRGCSTASRWPRRTGCAKRSAPGDRAPPTGPRRKRMDPSSASPLRHGPAPADPVRAVQLLAGLHRRPVRAPPDVRRLPAVRHLRSGALDRSRRRISAGPLDVRSDRRRAAAGGGARGRGGCASNLVARLRLPALAGRRPPAPRARAVHPQARR